MFLTFSRLFSVILLLSLQTRISNCNAIDSDAVIKPEPRIVNGTVALLANTKHQASIRLRANDGIFGNGHICGGTVIGPKKILSAAHCLYNEDRNRFRKANEFLIVVGTLNRMQKTANTLSFRVTSIAYPKTFSIDTLVDDVAIFFLDGEIPANSPTVQPIQMTTVNDTLPRGTVCQVSGWGTTEEKGSLTNALMTVDVPILDKTLCNIAYANSLSRGMMCAGYMAGQKDSCQGDSGGPLVCNAKLGGVVSWGNGCARVGFPGIYTNVTYYYDWIAAQKGNAATLRSSVAAFIVGFIVFICNLN